LSKSALISKAPSPELQCAPCSSSLCPAFPATGAPCSGLEGAVSGWPVHQLGSLVKNISSKSCLCFESFGCEPQRPSPSLFIHYLSQRSNKARKLVKSTRAVKSKESGVTLTLRSIFTTC